MLNIYADQCVGFRTIEEANAYFAPIKIALGLETQAGKDLIRELKTPAQMEKVKAEGKITYQAPKFPIEEHKCYYLTGLQRHLTEHFGRSKATLDGGTVCVTFPR